MADPTKPATPPAATDSFAAQDPCGEDNAAYSTLFQAWLLLFLAVICFALVNYLISYLPW
jgi:hypothetical protein